MYMYMYMYSVHVYGHLYVTYYPTHLTYIEVHCFLLRSYRIVQIQCKCSITLVMAMEVLDSWEHAQFFLC